jgi:HD-GYP domain-containing protein (c-di-GMP phosphodiesterase class II)
MRRVSVRKVEPGMVLSRDIIGERGDILLQNGTTLVERQIKMLHAVEASEIVVEDPRVDDVIVVPLVETDTEIKAIKLLHNMMDRNHGKTAAELFKNLKDAERLVRDMVTRYMDKSFTSTLSEIYIDGCLSLGQYEYVHPTKTAALAMLLGKEAKMEAGQLMFLGMAALLQNVGYVIVPADEKLSISKTEDGPQFIKHAEYGCRIMRQYPVFDDSIAEAIWQHHERWDGSGYPRRLCAEQISLPSRIISIADCYHALVSQRICRPPYSHGEAFEYIAAYSGEIFDPDLAKLFLNTLPVYPKGLLVKLSSGEIGIVTESQAGDRPTVRILYDRFGNEADKIKDIDLTSREYMHKSVLEIDPEIVPTMSIIA